MAALASGRIALADTLEDECLRELAAEEVRTSKRGRASIVQLGPNESADCLSCAAAIWLGMVGSTLSQGRMTAASTLPIAPVTPFDVWEVP